MEPEQSRVAKVRPPPRMFKPPAIVEVAVVEVASMVPVYSLSAWRPPAKVEVAVVVAKIPLTVKLSVEVASREVPLNHTRPFESRVALVPPELIPNAVPKVRPPVIVEDACERMPPAKVETELVLVAFTYPV